MFVKSFKVVRSLCIRYQFLGCVPNFVTLVVFCPLCPTLVFCPVVIKLLYFPEAVIPRDK